MPITPNPMPFGFSGTDIASIASAREGMARGFEALGKQVREDITRIGTMRQLKSFGEELSQIDPRSDAFPQQATQLLSRYPMAANTQFAGSAINMLGRVHQDWKQGTTASPFQFFSSGGNIVGVDRKTGTANVVYEEPELPEKDVIRSVPGVGLVSVNPTTKETTTLVATPTQGGRSDIVFESQEGVKHYRDGTMVTPDGRVVRPFAGRLTDITDPANPRVVNDSTLSNLLLKSQLGMAGRRREDARKAFMEERATYEGLPPDQRGPRASKLREIQKQFMDAELELSNLIQGAQSGQPTGQPSGIGTIGVGAQPMIQTPTQSPNLLPGNQNAPLPGEESVLPSPQSQSSYRTKEDVIRAFQRGIIKDRNEAKRILIEQFGETP